MEIIRRGLIEMECSRALSREEQEELVRSKKKVKNVSHAGSKKGWIQLLRLRGMMAMAGAEPRRLKINWLVKSLVRSHKPSTLVI